MSSCEGRLKLGAVAPTAITSASARTPRVPAVAMARMTAIHRLFANHGFSLCFEVRWLWGSVRQRCDVATCVLVTAQLRCARRHGAILLRDDGDASGVGGGDDGRRVEEQGPAGLEGEAGCAGARHGLDGGDADDGDVEAHVLIGFGDFDDGEGAAEDVVGGFAGRGSSLARSRVRKSAPARSMVASVPSMASTATQAWAAMTTVWPRS